MTASAEDGSIVFATQFVVFRERITLLYSGNIMHFSSILVTTDFSDESRVAFELPAYESKMEGTKIHLMAVIEDDGPLVDALWDSTASEKIRSYRSELVERAEEKLKSEAAHYFHGQAVTVKVVLSKKSVAEEVTSYAREQGCDLIVLASHGRGAMAHLLLGSVASKTIQLADCPVLVVPRGGRARSGC